MKKILSKSNWKKLPHTQCWILFFSFYFSFLVIPYEGWIEPSLQDNLKDSENCLSSSGPLGKFFSNWAQCILVMQQIINFIICWGNESSLTQTPWLHPWSAVHGAVCCTLQYFIFSFIFFLYLYRPHTDINMAKVLNNKVSLYENNP